MGLLGVDDLSSSGQRRPRRAVGKIFEVQCESSWNAVAGRRPSLGGKIPVLHKDFLQGSISQDRSGQGSIRALNGENLSGFQDASA